VANNVEESIVVGFILLGSINGDGGDDDDDDDRAMIMIMINDYYRNKRL